MHAVNEQKVSDGLADWEVWRKEYFSLGRGRAILASS
jgi:hypothetical protein